MNTLFQAWEYSSFPRQATNLFLEHHEAPTSTYAQTLKRAARAYTLIPYFSDSTPALAFIKSAARLGVAVHNLFFSKTEYFTFLNTINLAALTGLCAENFLQYWDAQHKKGLVLRILFLTCKFGFHYTDYYKSQTAKSPSSTPPSLNLRYDDEQTIIRKAQSLSMTYFDLVLCHSIPSQLHQDYFLQECTGIFTGIPIRVPVRFKWQGQNYYCEKQTFIAWSQCEPSVSKRIRGQPCYYSEIRNPTVDEVQFRLITNRLQTIARKACLSGFDQYQAGDMRAHLTILLMHYTTNVTLDLTTKIQRLSAITSDQKTDSAWRSGAYLLQQMNSAIRMVSSYFETKLPNDEIKLICHRRQ